jgi:hypothetical protein
MVGAVMFAGGIAAMMKMEGVLKIMRLREGIGRMAGD